MQSAIGLGINVNAWRMFDKISSLKVREAEEKSDDAEEKTR